MDREKHCRPTEDDSLSDVTVPRMELRLVVMVMCMGTLPYGYFDAQRSRVWQPPGGSAAVTCAAYSWRSGTAGPYGGTPTSAAIFALDASAADSAVIGFGP